MKKIPLRKCIACQEMKSKKELIRIVRTPDQEVLIDPTGKKSGRGAYLCNNEGCFQLSIKKKALSRALSVEISEDVYNQLAARFAGVGHDK
ncbi:MAG: YlxR family protein [Bacilli bacterium]